MDDQSDDGKRQKNLGPGLLAMQKVNAERRAAGLPVGRRRGTPNKLTEHVRTAVLKVYEDLGGHEAFARWAKKHPGQFYSLMVKLAPKEREANAVGTGVQIFIQDTGSCRPVVNERRVLDDVPSDWTDGGAPVLPDDEDEDQGPTH